MKSDSVTVMNVVKGEHAMPEIPIRFIGHPMIDVGVATLCAAAGVSDPRDLTPEAIDRFTAYVTELYLNKNLAGFLGAGVFPNARFANPNKLSESTIPERRTILTELLNLWKPSAPKPTTETVAGDDDRCAFSGDPASIRVSGMYIPLLTDETKINFMPSGKPKLPISGWCLLAFLVMPLGGIISEGQLLIATSSNNQTTISLAKANLERNEQTIQMESQAPRPSYIFAKSMLIETLIKLFRAQTTTQSITAYLFAANADPRRGKVTINHLSSAVIRFLSIASRQYEAAWDHIVRKAEWTGKTREKNTSVGKKREYFQRNYFYEDLWDLPHNSRHFLRLYFLRIGLKGKPDKNDPRQHYQPLKDLETFSWDLTALFLKEVMRMDQKRIENIRLAADQIADYIVTHNKPKTLKKLYEARDDAEFRNIFIRTSYELGKSVMNYEQFVDVYFHRDEQGGWRTDWRLARDLLLIRILEQLGTDWASENKSELEYTEESENTEA